MSTICYKDGVMACDSLMTNVGEPQDGIVKIGRTKRFLFGFSGTLTALWPMYDWLVKVEKSLNDPTYFYEMGDLCLAQEDSGTALIADPCSGKVWSVYPSGGAVPHPRGFEAIGSGGAYAVGAMMAGCGAKAAIGIAMLCDVGTGGTIHALDQHSKPARPYAY